VELGYPSFPDEMSQSVPRDGGYCNDRESDRALARDMSQSVPRDGGYCNAFVP